MKRAVLSPEVVETGRAPTGVRARCYACGEPLALSPLGRGGYISSRLVPRPEPHPSGLPRYGPPREAGPRHARARRGWLRWRRGGEAIRFYVNCPGCNRGQVVDLEAIGPR